MNKNKLLPILFWWLLASTNGFAQNNNPRKAYDDFKKQAQQQYYDFRTQANEEYAAFLKRAWEQYNVLPAIPKPKVCHLSQSPKRIKTSLLRAIQYLSRKLLCHLPPIHNLRLSHLSKRTLNHKKRRLNLFIVGQNTKFALIRT